MKKKLNVLAVLLMLVVLLGSTSVAFAEGEDLGTWTAKANMPTARGELEAVSVNGKIYAIGGKYSVNYITAVEEYDPSTNTWTTKVSMPTERRNMGAAAVGDKIYVIGGMNQSAGKLATVEEYDLSTDTWTTKANMPTMRYGLEAVAVNGKIYAIGGNMGPSVSTVEEYDPSTDTWTAKASMPTPRELFGATVLDGKIYAIGGYRGTTVLGTVEEYDPVADTWTTKASMPTPRKSFEVETVNGKLYAIGGDNDCSNLVEEYDPITDTWRTVQSTLQKRFYSGAAKVNGEIYVMGGSGSASCSSLEAFTPPTTQQPPESPTNLTATAGDSEVTLSWDSVTDATSYTVKRATTLGGPYTTIASDVTNTNYTDTDVTNDTTYYYVVTATVNGTETGNSNEASATPNASTPTPPQTGAAILVIKMVDGTQKEYDLTMTKVNDFIDWYEDKDNGSGNPYYTIQKDWNQGPFDARKDYIIFSKICYFEINEY